MLKPLPIGIQTFRDIIQGGFLYVDKTRWLYEVIRYPKGVYFLSRPRRFGKSLLLSTLEEIFLGNKELFKGLWLYDSSYAWTTHPIIRVDFGQHRVADADTLTSIISQTIQDIAHPSGVQIREGALTQQFSDLIIGMAGQGQVVILIDEYDKPILDNLENLEEAKRIRDVLKGFYTVIKSLDAHLRFVLLTGVSKFSQVGVFSGLNNLLDITMHPRHSALLGFTEDELQQNFGEYIAVFAGETGQTETELLRQIQAWYNGFCFSEDCLPVYNPFSLLQLVEQRKFRNYWFESGTPTFLVRLLQERHYDVSLLDRLEVTELAFSTYELESLDIIPLLFQSGYLTIKGYNSVRRLYRLGYPNLEVEQAFSQVLLGAFSAVDAALTGSYLWRLIDALDERDMEGFFELLSAFFAGIDYRLLIQQERYYQSITSASLSTCFYLIFKLMGLHIQAEVRTSRGRIDAVIERKTRVYIFEFKLGDSAEAALAQIRERGYADPYRQSGKQIILVGVKFDMAERGIADWQIADGAG
jgi:hypothetical protein